MPTSTWQTMNGEIQRPLGWEDVTTPTLRDRYSKATTTTEKLTLLAEDA
jgi:hypothetical protein